MQPASIEDVLLRYQQYGHRMYGESVTELGHALQCATLAQQAGEREQLVAAALLHDFGHLCHDLGEDIAMAGCDAQHERLGVMQLAGLFDDAVLAPIRLHVAAKRFLCATAANYAATLSPASKLSLRLQGGPMLADECHAFAREPFATEALRLRRYDDAAKVASRKTANLEAFLPVLQRAQQPTI
jgi:[1-hydroxy-2-(trimethylamino)ethyl]phosphonate dioxygenase